MSCADCPMPLTCFARGTCVRLAFSALGGPEARRLGEMGLCDGAHCTIVQNAEKLIVAVGGSRLGLPRELGMQLFAHEVPGGGHAGAGVAA